ncbi:MAG: T9SS type A sorting domain-containing protein [Ferruginibacter sp.]|nr:T9SS type A sorting domain-containing protein [Ferruginibacter sp.]
MKKLLRLTFPVLFTVALPAFLYSQNRVDIGKSFANISRLNGGGTFQPGDTIEIRVTIAVIKISSTTIIDSVQVFDQVPAGTTYLNGSMRVATNQGLTYKGPFTEAADADAGKNIGGNITINLGRYANGTRGGRIRADSSRPSFYGSHCIMMACYRVRINTTTSFGDTIRVGGSVKYKMISPNNGWSNITFPEYKILLFQYNGFCANGVSISAASDFNGSFGSGTTQNRALGMLFGTTYVKQNISTGQPNDYNYSIVNNSSANGSTNPNSTMPESPSSKRVFGVWDIAGDHTGATNLAHGNPPVAPGAKGGYFVLINASYNTNIAYTETLSNLCPNTYYEFSAWFRNVCPRCSCDSTGKGAGSAGFIPYPGNDSAGVRPNLSFEIDGLGYYTTGDIKYDRITPWKKFGFTFQTKPGQTTANFVIRNNSPGGGGNDWAIDDITVAHCGPSISSNYKPFVLGCDAQPFEVRLSDTVISVYNNYIYYQWQVSNIGGTIWTNVAGPGASGVGSPILVNGLYQYAANLPPFLAMPTDSGKYYRVIVATSPANLSSASCAYNDGNKTLIKVIDCGSVLTANLIRFKAIKTDNMGTLSWSTIYEDDSLEYEIQRSDDGIHFFTLATIPSTQLSYSSYNYTDPGALSNNVFYRLKLVNKDGLYKYSHIELISEQPNFKLLIGQNPFSKKLSFSLQIPRTGLAAIRIHSLDGKQIYFETREFTPGLHQISADKDFQKGIYILSVKYNNEVIRHRLIRQ